MKKNFEELWAVDKKTQMYCNVFYLNDFKAPWFFVLNWNKDAKFFAEQVTIWAMVRMRVHKKPSVFFKLNF